MNHGLHCHHVKHWVRVLSVKRHLAYIQLQGESFFAPISHKHRKRWSTTTKYILSNHRTFWHIGRMVYCYLIFFLKKSFLMMCSQMLSRVLWFDPAFFGTKQFCSRMFLIGLSKNMSAICIPFQTIVFRLFSWVLLSPIFWMYWRVFLCMWIDMGNFFDNIEIEGKCTVYTMGSHFCHQHPFVDNITISTNSALCIG